MHGQERTGNESWEEKGEARAGVFWCTLICLLLHILCRLCSISKSTDSSHFGLEHFENIHPFHAHKLKDVLMAGCAASLQAEPLPRCCSDSLSNA